CDLVPAAQAARILGFPVDTSHSGDTSSHCMYVGKSGYADLRVMPGDASRISMMMGGHKMPPGHSLAFGHKGAYIVYVTTTPKMDGAASALRDAAMGRL
ncbi:MAG: hypothetical protein M3126_11310, partial [Candidatus Eremiobacteraeota bacterium]|nr:hypothetical protein [Candidatus Eremiobacteraeota bacterium]